MATSNHDELQKLIRAVRAVGKLDEVAAPRVAEALGAEIKRTVAAGTDPYGVPWEPRKSDGGRPLVHGDKTLQAQTIGSLVIVTVTGEDARHSLGWARGGLVREIMPSKGLSDRMADACLEAVGKAFQEVVAAGERSSG
jgi:hypothetical protein